MANKAALSIDIGTTSLKAAVIDTEGQLLAFETHDITISTPHLTEKWEQLLEKMLPSMEGLNSIEAVCVTGNGPTLVPLDDSGRPAAPAVSWVDTRSDDSRKLSSIYLPKLMSALNTDEQLLERTSLFVGCPEYITGLLCGRWAMFIPDDRFIPYIWDAQQLSACGIDRDKVPPFVYTGARMGTVTAPASERFGIPQGTPVYAGLTDFHAALLGCGTVHPGMTCDRAGTSEGINVITASDARFSNVRTLPGIIPDTWTRAGLIPASGEVFQWYRERAGFSSLSYNQIMEKIEHVDLDGCCSFYPHPYGRHTAGEGLTGGQLVGQKLHETDPLHLGRAVAEGVGFTVRLQIDQLRRSGCLIERIRHCGGQARSPVWNRLKSRLLQIPLEVPVIADAELLGCAAVAFYGSGDFSSLQEASDVLVRLADVYTPEPDSAGPVNESYSVWLSRRAGCL